VDVDSFQLRVVAVDVQNKQSRTADKGDPPCSFGIDVRNI